MLQSQLSNRFRCSRDAGHDILRQGRRKVGSNTEPYTTSGSEDVGHDMDSKPVIPRVVLLRHG